MTEDQRLALSQKIRDFIQKDQWQSLLDLLTSPTPQTSANLSSASPSKRPTYQDLRAAVAQILDASLVKDLYVKLWQHKGELFAFSGKHDPEDNYFCENDASTIAVDDEEFSPAAASSSASPDLAGKNLPHQLEPWQALWVLLIAHYCQLTCFENDTHVQDHLIRPFISHGFGLFEGEQSTPVVMSTIAQAGIWLLQLENQVVMTNPNEFLRQTSPSISLLKRVINYFYFHSVFTKDPEKYTKSDGGIDYILPLSDWQGKDLNQKIDSMRTFIEEAKILASNNSDAKTFLSLLLHFFVKICSDMYAYHLSKNPSLENKNIITDGVSYKILYFYVFNIFNAMNVMAFGGDVQKFNMHSDKKFSKSTTDLLLEIMKKHWEALSPDYQAPIYAIVSSMYAKYEESENNRRSTQSTKANLSLTCSSQSAASSSAGNLEHTAPRDEPQDIAAATKSSKRNSRQKASEMLAGFTKATSATNASQSLASSSGSLWFFSKKDTQEPSPLSTLSILTRQDSTHSTVDEETGRKIEPSEPIKPSASSKLPLHSSTTSVVYEQTGHPAPPDENSRLIPMRKSGAEEVEEEQEPGCWGFLKCW